jgi:ABC-2 type transport system ATP-binding protein
MTSGGIMKVLAIEHLVKKFPEVTAVDDVSFEIEEGICFGLLGPNGAGKTTTIEIMEGLQNPTSGSVSYRGHERRRSYYENIGIQFQSTELPQFLNVRETLEFFRKLYNKQADLDYLIDLCRLDDIADRDNRKISGGQRQRLLLAMALANDPEVVYLDEPTTGLDPQARRHLWEIIEGIKRKKTVLLTTHYMEEAQILCDEIAIMDKGKIISHGQPATLIGEHFRAVTIALRRSGNEKALENIPWKFFQIEDMIEIHTAEPDACIRELVSRGVNLDVINVRSQNLEDLFLELTGNTLRS